MNHWKARRHVAAVLDRTLPGRLEADVLAHARHCRTCRRTLREHRAVEALVARLPASLVPLGGGGAAEQRLFRLARWAPEPIPAVGRWRAPALGVVAAVVGLMLQLSVTLPPMGAGATSQPWMGVSAAPSEAEAVAGMAGWR